MKAICDDISRILDRACSPAAGRGRVMVGTIPIMQPLLADLRDAGANDKIIKCVQALAAVVARCQTEPADTFEAFSTNTALADVRRQWEAANPCRTI